MKKKIRIVIICILVAALAVSAVLLIRQMLDYKKGASDYEEAKSMVNLPEIRPAQPEQAPEQAPAAPDAEEAPAEPVDPYLEALRAMDISVLQQINPDVVGWIEIPSTVVSYPILHTNNNSYYLNKTWRKDYSSVGSIFLECENRADLSQFNTLIYGHNMRDGSMFCNLRSYLEQDYWQQHPYVYLAVENDVRRYDIYAAYEVGVWEITYGLEFKKDEDKQEFIDFGLSKSKIDTGIVPTVEDEVLTLSTCTGNGNAAAGNRWVIQAVWNRDAG